MNFVHWWQKVLKVGVLEVKDNQVLQIWKNLVGTMSYQRLLRREFKKSNSCSACSNFYLIFIRMQNISGKSFIQMG